MVESSSVQSYEPAKELLEGLFEILDNIVEDAKSTKEDDPEDCCKLKDIKHELKKIKACFTQDSCAIFLQTKKELEIYKNRIQSLLIRKPKPEVSPNHDDVVREVGQGGS